MKLKVCLFILALILSFMAHAELRDYNKDYYVIDINKGDYLRRYFRLWNIPESHEANVIKILKEKNPQIKNPDLIYPNQELFVPKTIIAQYKKEAPPRLPSSIEAPPKTEEKKRFKLDFLLSFSYLKSLDKVNDQNASIESDLNKALVLENHFDNNFIKLKYNKIKYQEPANKKITNKNFDTLDFTYGRYLFKKEQLSSTLAINLKSTSLLLTDQNSELIIKTSYMPRLILGLNYHNILSDKISIYHSLYTYYAASQNLDGVSVEQESAWSYSADIIYNKNKNLKYQGGIIYKKEFLDADIIKQTTEFLYFGFGFTYFY